jgi:aspartate/methionine/tyrosine aminotransferase
MFFTKFFTKFKFIYKKLFNKFKLDLKTSEDFTIALYKEKNINVIPGSIFLSENFFRVVLCADK